LTFTTGFQLWLRRRLSPWGRDSDRQRVIEGPLPTGTVNPARQKDPLVDEALTDGKPRLQLAKAARSPNRDGLLV
jgi:hypothetical protein